MSFPTNRASRPGPSASIVAVAALAVLAVAVGPASRAADADQRGLGRGRHPASEGVSSFVLASCTVVDDRCALGGVGSADGNLDPGESASLEMVIVHEGPVAQTNLVVQVESPAPAGVVITNGMFTIPTVGASETFTLLVPFDTDATLLGCNSAVVFTATIEVDGATYGPLACTIAVPPACNPCGGTTTPGFSLVGCAAVDDACAEGGAGSGNGAVDPGESATFQMTLTFDGPDPVAGVEATVAASGPGVTLLSQPGPIGALTPGETFVVEVDFSTSVNGVACGDELVFTVALEAAGVVQAYTCIVALPVNCQPCGQQTVAEISFQGCNLSDDSCPGGGAAGGDGQLDPGEDGVVDFAFVNEGPGTAEDVAITVSSGTPGVTVGAGTLTFASVAAGEAFVASVSFSTDASLLNCGDDLLFVVVVQSAGVVPTTFTCLVSIPLPCTPCSPSQPTYAFSGCSIVDDACGTGGPGDGDGLLDPGESATLSLALTYGGAATVTNVVVTVDANTPGVTVGGPVIVPSIEPGETFIVDVPVSTDVTALPCGITIGFVATVQSDGATFGPFTCAITVPAACNPCGDPGPTTITIQNCGAVDDLCAAGGEGDGDGNVDPGEIGLLVFTLLHAGPTLQNAVVQVEVETPGVNLLGGGTYPVPTLPSGEPFTVTTAFEVDASVSCGTQVIFSITLQANGAVIGPLTCVVEIPDNCIPCDTDDLGGLVVIVGPGGASLVIGWDETMGAANSVFVGDLESLWSGGQYSHSAAACGVLENTLEVPMPAGDVYVLVGQPPMGGLALGTSSAGEPRPEGESGCP